MLSQVRSYIGYHCNRPDYRPACKTAFRLWGESLRFTQLQLHQKQLRKLQAMQAEEMRTARDKERSRSHHGGRRGHGRRKG